jgi:hypothetical protein
VNAENFRTGDTFYESAVGDEPRYGEWAICEWFSRKYGRWIGGQHIEDIFCRGDFDNPRLWWRR